MTVETQRAEEDINGPERMRFRKQEKEQRRREQLAEAERWRRAVMRSH